MRKSNFYVIGLMASLLMLASAAQATTLTFLVPEFDPDNTTTYGIKDVDVPVNYGSDVNVDTVELVTSDGTGVTPNIALTWAPLPNVWEFHAGAAFQRSFGFENMPIVQLQCSGNPPPSDPTITFTPDAGYGVKINSFDMGSADNSGPSTPYYWTITINEATDPNGTPVFSKNTLNHYRLDNSVEHFVIDFQGDPGVAYVMRFDDGGVNSYNTCIKNLSFSQVVPEPGSIALLLGGLLAWAAWRRK